MIKGKANVVIDGSWGSTGKGKLCGYLALRHDINLVTCNYMSNAGHTFVRGAEKFVTCQLPTGIVNRDALIVLNAGSAITLTRLFREIEELDRYNIGKRLFIHPHASVITEEDRKYEAEVLKRISSTMKGCGGSRSRKVMRTGLLAKDVPELNSFITDTDLLTQMSLERGETVLVESAQGFDLSLNFGHKYPYVTSRDVTTSSVLCEAGVPLSYLGSVYGCLRTFPIRVGNIVEDGEQVGYSGPFYDDQEELTWDEISSMCGEQVEEKTTVTGKVRRVFSFSKTQLIKFARVCEPTHLFLNFANYISSGVKGKRSLQEMDFIDRSTLSSWVCRNIIDPISTLKNNHAKLTHVGTGADDKDMIEIDS